MQEVQRYALAQNLAKWAKALAMEFHLTPAQIRQMTVKDIKRFYSKDVSMPKREGNA